MIFFLFLLTSFISFLGQFPHMHVLLSAQSKLQRVWGVLCRSLEFSLCVFLLSGILPCELELSWLSKSDTASILGHCWASLGFPLPVRQPGNFAEAVKWDNRRPYFVCFLSLSGHFYVLPDVQCLNTVVPYFCVALSLCFWWELSKSSDLLILAEAEVVE